MKTRIINIKDKKAVSSAVAVLKKGRLVVYPTETSYGLGADATNSRALEKINRIKKRKGKFIPIIVSDMKMAEKYLVLNNDIKKLIRSLMPGPLTLIAKKKRLDKKIGGFRVPGNRFACNLAKRFGKPITATSANISGKKGIYRINEIIRVFSGKVELIVDSGNLPQKQPSTIFDVCSKKVLRKGKISRKEIFRILDD